MLHTSTCYVAGDRTGHIEEVNPLTHPFPKAKDLAVTKCTCRLVAHKCDRPLEVCLQVDNAASYAVLPIRDDPILHESYSWQALRSSDTT